MHVENRNTRSTRPGNATNHGYEPHRTDLAHFPLYTRHAARIYTDSDGNTIRVTRSPIKMQSTALATSLAHLSSE